MYCMLVVVLQQCNTDILADIEMHHRLQTSLVSNNIKVIFNGANSINGKQVVYSQGPELVRQ